MTNPDRLPSSRWRKRGAACYFEGRPVVLTATGPDWVEFDWQESKRSPVETKRVKDYAVYQPPVRR